MGLFSKKTTYRDYTVTRVIEDAYLPNVMGQAITKFVLDKDNQKSLTDLMLEYGWSVNSYKWNMAYKWARTPGNYTYGNPKVGLVTQSDFTGSETLADVLAGITGGTINSYYYSKFDDINLRHAMWQLLVSQYGYSTASNEITTLSASVGKPVYLLDSINYVTPETTVYVAGGNQLDHWGWSPRWGYTPSRTADTGREDTEDRVSGTGNNYAKVEYTWIADAIKETTVVKDTTVTTAVTPPGGSTTTTTNTSSTTSTSKDLNGYTAPNNISKSTKKNESTTTNTVSGDPTSTTSTSADGTVTVTTTQVDTTTTVYQYDLEIEAYFNMGFGQYDIIPDTDAIDTTTVLDDNDSGNYDPDATLIESGESDADSESWFQVMYSWTTSAGTQRTSFFTYQYGSGSYDSLDGITDTSVADFGAHFPRMYFRLNGNKLISDDYADTDAYKTSKKFGNKLDMKWLEVGDEIYNSLSSLDKIRDVCMFLGCPLNTTNQLQMQYLFNYFTTFYNIRDAYTDDAVTTVQVAPENGSLTRPTVGYDTWNAHSGATQVSQDTGGVAMKFDCDALGYQEGLSGTVANVGEYATATGYDTKVVRYGVGYYDDSNQPHTRIYYVSAAVRYRSYKYQVTENTYNEVRVYDASSGAKIGGNWVTKSGTEEEELMVPLDWALRGGFSPHEAETLYALCCYLYIGTEYTIKTKWYQTGLFKAVVVVVAIVLSWWTGGASMSLISVISAAATAVGTMVIMSLLSKYVFSKLGGWFAILATVVAIIAIAYGGYLYLTNTTGAFSVTALDMMSASSVAFQAAQGNLSGQMQKYQAQMRALQDEQEAAQQKLDDANSMLVQEQYIGNDVLASVNAGYINLGENPLQMFQRTLDTNVGVGALTLPAMYLNAGTSLPSTIEIIQNILVSLNSPFELDLNETKEV